MDLEKLNRGLAEKIVIDNLKEAGLISVAEQTSEITKISETTKTYLSIKAK